MPDEPVPDSLVGKLTEAAKAGRGLHLTADEVASLAG